MNDSEERLKAIQEKYRKAYDKTIPEKLILLEGLLQEMQNGIQEPTLKAFRMEIHKIAGSAGTVGYDEVSAICKKLDGELSSMLEKFKDNPPDPAVVTSFKAEFNKVKESFN